MERRKKMTKTLISESLKGLMQKHPFEKITIKMITDAAGVIRPTFYNYFCDKYEVLEWIFVDEIVEKVRPMFEQGLYHEGIKMLFTCARNDGDFYKKAFEVKGQNSFETIVHNHLYDLFMDMLKPVYQQPSTSNQLISRSLVADHCVITLLYLLKSWISGSLQNFSTDDLVDAYHFLMENRLSDVMSVDF